jgi:hypothetical protein
MYSKSKQWLRNCSLIITAFVFQLVITQSTAYPIIYTGLQLEKEQYETGISAEEYQLQSDSEKNKVPPGGQKVIFISELFNGYEYPTYPPASEVVYNNIIRECIPFERPPLYIAHHSWKFDICQC